MSPPRRKKLGLGAHRCQAHGGGEAGSGVMMAKAGRRAKQPSAPDHVWTLRTTPGMRSKMKAQHRLRGWDCLQSDRHVADEGRLNR